MLPQTSLKELKKLSKAPILKRVKIVQLEETLGSTIQAASAWETELKTVLNRMHPQDLGKAAYGDLQQLERKLESVARACHTIPANLKTSKKLGKARSLIKWFIWRRKLFPNDENS